MDVRGCYDKNNVVPEALRLINQALRIAPHAFDFGRGLVDNLTFSLEKINNS